MKKPLVAGVQGRAVGIGLTLLLHCDHVIVADDAQLSAPFVSLALVPEAASSLLLPARVGHARAFTVFALGEVIDASTAVAMGLANRAMPKAELAAAVDAIALRLAKQPLGAVVATPGALMLIRRARCACSRGRPHLPRALNVREHEAVTGIRRARHRPSSPK
ncbi:MAG: enoyl-CoA hydratase-related protein [Polyangiaceae bacterium]